MTSAALTASGQDQAVRGWVETPRTVASKRRRREGVCMLQRAPPLPLSAAEDGRACASGALLGILLQTRCSVARPDPATTQGQSSIPRVPATKTELADAVSGLATSFATCSRKAKADCSSTRIPLEYIIVLLFVCRKTRIQQQS